MAVRSQQRRRQSPSRDNAGSIGRPEGMANPARQWPRRHRRQELCRRLPPRGLVDDTPFAFTCRIARTPHLVVLVMPVFISDQWRIVELAHKIIAGRTQVKVEAPIGVMVMNVADT